MPRQKRILSKSKEDELFKAIMARYKSHWDKNEYVRDNWDTDLEYYSGYRNSSDYPLAYNTSHNRILPIIYTILSRFMDQVFQSGNIVSVKPRKRRDLHRAQAAENVLNYQMESMNEIDTQGGAYLTFMKWFFNTINFGKGITKAYWRKEERIGPRRIAMPVPSFDQFGRFQGMDVIDYVNQEMQTVYDGPYMEVIHNKMFLPDTEYKNIQQMPMVFLIYRKSMDYVKKMADKGIYTNLDQLGPTSAGGAGTEDPDSREAFIKSLRIESAYTEETDNPSTSEYLPQMVDIIEGYGRLILEDQPYEVGSGYKIKGPEAECVFHIGNYKTFLSLTVNQYGQRPLFDMGCYMQPEIYWDYGLVRLTRGIQEQINNLANLRLQNAMMMINPMLKILDSSDVDPRALVWKPFGIVPVSDMNEVEPLTIQDFHSQLFLEQEAFYKNTIQDIMGMYDYNMGATPTRQERVGVVYGIQAMGEARAKLLLMSMDYLGMRPLLKYLMTLNTFHLPSGFEYRIGDSDQQQFGQVFGQDLHSDFDFAARYTAMEPALGKQYRAQQLVQMAAMWAQNPWINQYQLNKTMMELLDIREADMLLKSPQQMQQETQQAVQQQMKAEQMKQQLETTGKLAVGQQEYQSDSALSQQDFQQDLILEAMRLEAQNQNAD